jgi:hypothetical protein
MQHNPSCEANSRSTCQKFPAYCETRKFITVFTRARWTHNHARYSFKTILILSSHLRIRLLPWGLRLKTCTISHLRHEPDSCSRQMQHDRRQEALDLHTLPWQRPFWVGEKVSCYTLNCRCDSNCFAAIQGQDLDILLRHMAYRSTMWGSMKSTFYGSHSRANIHHCS